MPVEMPIPVVRKGWGDNSMSSTWSGDRAFMVDLSVGGSTGPTVDPTIQSFVISGNSATLTWDSETGVTYTILNKSSLGSGSWVEVKTDIAGAGSSTTDSVDLSGETKEFFKVEGN